MTINNKCNHALAIAKEMYTAYVKKQTSGCFPWSELTSDQRNGWLAVAEQSFPIIGKHALGDVRNYLTEQAKTSTGWRKWLYWAGGIIIAGLLVGGAATMSGCGHNVDVTPDRTEVCKDGSCLVIEQGHISYSQAQPETDVPPFVQLIPSKK